MKKIVVAVVLVAIATCGVFFSQTDMTKASATPQSEVTQAVTQYLQDLKTGNTEDAVKYVHDYRFKNDADTLDNYKDIAKYDPVSDAKLIDVKMKSASEGDITIQVTTANIGVHQFVLPVKKEGNQWKVILKNVEKVKYQGKTSTQSSGDAVISSNVANTNPLQLDKPGPIQHYLWLHNGESDEVWQNGSQGLWRIVSTMQDGSTQKGIYKNGYLYLMHYNADGKLLGAEKIAQPAGYDGKQSVFDGMKQSFVGAKSKGQSKYNNVNVNVLQKTNQGAAGSETTTFYVDTIHNLPVKVEHDVNGNVSTETWTYSYLPQDDSLFQLPAGITFEDAPASKVPAHK